MMNDRNTSDMISVLNNKNPVFKVGDQLRVRISYAVSSQDFVVQDCRCEGLLEMIEKNCQDSGKRQKALKPGQLIPGTLCLAKSPNDDRWYRVMIAKVDQGKKYATIMYLDFGGSEDLSLPTNSLVDLEPSLAGFDPQAVKCQLGLRQPKVEDSTLTDLEYSKKQFIINILGIRADSVTHGTIYVVSMPGSWNWVTKGTLKKLELWYQDAHHYEAVLAPLIQLETKYNSEEQTYPNIVVRWHNPSRKAPLKAFFHLPVQPSSLKLMNGDEIILRYEGPEGDKTESWKSIGTVCKAPDEIYQEIGIEIKRNDRAGAPIYRTTDFSVEIMQSSTSFDRMLKALDRFSVEGETNFKHFYHTICGHTIQNEVYSIKLPKDFSGVNLDKLNQSQAFAVKNALEHQFCLIQGPPGTGKTLTCASIIYHLAKLNEGPLMVCAPSNIAVDALAEKIHATGLRVIRLESKSREEKDIISSCPSLQNEIRRMSRDTCPELCGLLQEKVQGSWLSRSSFDRLKDLEETFVQKILEGAKVIACTCVCAGDPRLKSMLFSAVLIDECMQATEPETLIPILRSSKQLILVGDQRQLGPLVQSDGARQAGLATSFFERLISLGMKPFRLQVQYRMHPVLSSFPSDMFYEGSLEDGVSAEDRKLNIMFPWPVPDKPLMFYATKGVEEVSHSGHSYLNRTEASFVEEVCSRFLKAGLMPEQIGVITPYEAQRSYLQGCMVMKPPSGVEVASVDAFQGREKDIIILTCVRSNDKNTLGFLNDPRRLNVSISRAKYGLIIVGNPEGLVKNQLWKKLIQYCQDLNVFVEGPLSNLKQVQSAFLQRPKPSAPVTPVPKELLEQVIPKDICEPALPREETQWQKTVGKENQPPTEPNQRTTEPNQPLTEPNQRTTEPNQRPPKPFDHAGFDRVLALAAASRACDLNSGNGIRTNGFLFEELKPGPWVFKIGQCNSSKDFQVINADSKNVELFERMAERMSRWYNNENNTEIRTVDNIIDKAVYSGYCEKSRNWCRVMIDLSEEMEGDTVVAFFCDHGKLQKLKQSNLRHLEEEFRKLPFQAFFAETDCEFSTDDSSFYSSNWSSMEEMLSQSTERAYEVEIERIVTTKSIVPFLTLRFINHI